MSEFSKRLGKLKGNWGKARKRDRSEFGGSTLEDAIYKMEVTSAELTESQSSGRLQVCWEYTVLEGESKGETIRDYDGMESEDNLFFIQRKLERLGFDAPEDPAEIEGILNKVGKKKPKIKARVRTKDDFTHVYVNRLLDGEAGEEEAAQETDAEEPEFEAEAEAEAEPEAEPEPEGEGEVELQEGMKVTFPSGGKELEGEILNFIDDDTKARVKTEKGVFKVKIESLTPAEGEGEPEEVEAEPEAEPEPEKPRKPVASKGKVSKVKKKK